MTNFKNFYTAYLMGGLGNQMFQIAHTYSQGLRNKVEVKFKPSAYTPMQANQPTKYVNNIFSKINFENITENVKQISTGFGFQEVNPPINENIEFYGYYQSSKNFYGFGEEIKNIFSPSESFIKKIYEKYPQLSERNNVSLHLRRGDYLSISNVLPIIDTSYIEKCLQLIQNYDNLFIFSDDKVWVKDNLNFKNSIFVEGLEDYEELWTIGLCSKNIMSNSTFSWWGSYLNKNENKEVYVPSIWFGPNGERNFDDIYETSWIKINVEYKNGFLCC